jgi:hypothetical protein
VPASVPPGLLALVVSSITTAIPRGRETPSWAGCEMTLTRPGGMRLLIKFQRAIRLESTLDHDFTEARGFSSSLLHWFHSTRVVYLFLAKLPFPAADSDRMATVPLPAAKLILGEKVPQPVFATDYGRRTTD